MLIIVRKYEDMEISFLATSPNLNLHLEMWPEFFSMILYYI